MNKARIGFVGLGLMGGAMVKNLLAGGFPVTGYDIDRQKTSEFSSLGVKMVSDLEALPPGVDVIMLSLPNSDVVEDVLGQGLKLFEGVHRGLVLIDTTTADPLMSQRQAAGLRKTGVEMLDATISGTSVMCREKDIIYMVGGAEEVFESCRPIFAALGKKTYYLGQNGSGALMKLIVNLVLGLNRFVLAEGLALGKKAGMDQARLLEVLKNSAAYSRAMDMKGNKMIERDFEPPEGKLAFHLKDVRLILSLAQRIDFPLFLSGLHAQALAALVSQGRGEWDNSAIISFYHDLAEV